MSADDAVTLPHAFSGQRLDWRDLPRHVRRRIDELAGAQVSVEITATEGFPPGFVAVLELADGRDVFVKAISREISPIAVGQARQEIVAAAALPDEVPAPRLQWSDDDGEWVLLGFDAVHGRSPELPWKRSDLELVLATERSRPELFTTVSMLAVHPDRRHADLYLAGHPVPMLVDDPARLLPASARGRALGIPVPGGWDPLPLELGDRWRVMLYTDGLLEATVGGGGERLGKDGLLRVVEGAVATHGHVPAVPPGAGDDPLVTTVLDAVRDRHGGDLVDDAAVIVIGRTS